MAQSPKPSNVVPFRKPEGAGGPRFRMPAWMPRDLVGTATGWIVLANIVVWIAMIAASYGAGVLTRFPTTVTFAFGSLVPDLIATEPWRLLSSTYIHADIGHIAMNMAILWFAGRQLERAYGPGRLALLYFVAALTGSLFSLGWHYVGSPGTSVGASGGVLGVVAGLAVFFWRATGRNSEPTKQWLWFCGLGLIGGIVTSALGMPVDNAAHLGGMAGGAGLSWLFAGRPGFKPAITRAILAGGALLVVASIGLSLGIGSRVEALDPDKTNPTASREGAEALARRDFPSAEKKLGEAIEENPDDPWLRTLRATALLNLERDDEAMTELDVADEIFQAMREREPQNALVAFGHAKVLLLEQREAEGIEALRAAVKGRASDGETFGKIATALEELGQLEDARLAASKARINDPRNPKLRELHDRINAKIAAAAHP